MWTKHERKDRIIFLDIDGVLDSIHFFKSKAYHNRKFKYGCDMSNMINRYNLFWVGLLCKVTGARVVLSSTWKYGYNEDGTVKEMEEGHNLRMTDKLFRKYGVNIFSITRKGELTPPDWEINKKALKEWCERMKHTDFIECSREDFTMKYCRGTQIAEWIVRNNYQGNYIVVDDDISDIVFYKDLEKRLVSTSYYKRYDGFRFLHFLKGLRLLLWGVK